MNSDKISTVDLPVDTAKTVSYRNDPEVHETLRGVNARLAGLECELAERADDLPDPQLVLIAYVPRSGSTVLSQLLARTSQFNYISNFQARFWRAPYIGGILERSLCPRDCTHVPLQSRHGLTPTTASPAEFTYFWRHWLKLAEDAVHTLDDQRQQRIDLAGMRRQLQLLGSLRGAPLFFKKEWLGMNAGLFLDAFPSVKFLHIRRNVVDVACSIAEARRAVYGSIEHWWAARPASYAELRGLPWPEQIAGQIRGILADTARWEDKYPDRFLSVNYEDLAADVWAELRRIGDFLDLDLALNRLPRCLSRPGRREGADAEVLGEALRQGGLRT